MSHQISQITRNADRTIVASFCLCAGVLVSGNSGLPTSHFRSYSREKCKPLTSPRPLSFVVDYERNHSITLSLIVPFGTRFTPLYIRGHC